MTSRPPRRQLPGTKYVTLSEALTWIAFGDAMKCEELRVQVEGHRPPVSDDPNERVRKFFAHADEGAPDVPGIGHFEDRRSGLGRLTEAWRQLRDAVDRGNVKMRGRLTSKMSLADAYLAEVEELNGNILATFSQFDVSTGALRRQPEGSPSILWQGDPRSFDREYESFGDDARAADGYLLVEVERIGASGQVSLTTTARSPSVKDGHPPEDKAILAKADEMKARGMDGRTIASMMRLEEGFENVATVAVRELLKGRWKPGGRPKRKTP